MRLFVPACHNLTPENKSYKEISQWNGKEMKEVCWYWLGVVTESLRGGSTDYHLILNHAIECTPALVEFFVYAPY